MIKFENALNQSIRDGIRKFFVFGYVQYWDEFGLERGLLYCFTYEPRLNGYAYCRSHNDAW